MATAPCDMRKQADGLSALVEGSLGQAAKSGHLFVFFSKRKDFVRIFSGCQRVLHRQQATGGGEIPSPGPRGGPGGGACWRSRGSAEIWTGTADGFRESAAPAPASCSALRLRLARGSALLGRAAPVACPRCVMMSAWWTMRSMSAVAQAALGKMPAQSREGQVGGEHQAASPRSGGRRPGRAGRRCARRRRGSRPRR